MGKMIRKTLITFLIIVTGIMVKAQVNASDSVVAAFIPHISYAYRTRILYVRPNLYLQILFREEKLKNFSEDDLKDFKEIGNTLKLNVF